MAPFLMVKLIGLPDKDVIRAFKGSIDFYVHKGQARVRSWPRWTLTERSPRVVAQQPWLAEADAQYSALRPFTSWGLKQLARTGSFTSRDIFMKHYFGTCPDPVPYTHTPCPHPTPFPFPDPVHHYQFPQGVRLREEANGDRFMDFLMPESARPYAYYRFIQVWSSIAPAFHPLLYTRRGITYTGYVQPIAHQLDVAWLATWDPAGFWSLPFKYFYDIEPENFLFFTIRSYNYLPGPGEDDRSAQSPMYAVDTSDWHRRGVFPRYSPPPSFHSTVRQRWRNYRQDWNTGWADFW